MLRFIWSWLMAPLNEHNERLKSDDEEAIKWWSIR